MYKLLIHMDEEKILREGRYNLNEVLETVDKMAQKCILSKKEGVYFGEKENTHGFIMALLNTKWFMDNVAVWELYNIEKNSFEDIIATCRRKGAM